MGFGIQTDPDYWSFDLRKLVKNDASLAQGLAPCGLSTGFDHCSVWHSQANAPIIEFLKQNAGLVTTNHLHKRASELISQKSPEWSKLHGETSSGFATPGFATRHLECVDLFLLVIESDTSNALVLYEITFESGKRLVHDTMHQTDGAAAATYESFTRLDSLSGSDCR